MWWEKGKFRTLSLYSWLNDMKIDNFLYFYHPYPLERDMIFKESLFDCTYLNNLRNSPVDTRRKLNVHKMFNLRPAPTGGCIGSFSQKKKHWDVSRAIVTTKMELSVALVIGFQPLTNFTKNPNVGAMRVINAHPEYYNVFWNLCRWSN